MLILTLWSSSASLMVLSREMLRRVAERSHPCRTAKVVLNQYPVLTLNKTSLLALLYRFSMIESLYDAGMKLCTFP